MVFLLAAQINLGLQIAILAALFTGFVLKRRRRYLYHGTVMLAVTVLNVASLLAVMGPSLLGLSGTVGEKPLGTVSLFVIAHATIGTVALALAVWIIATWRLRSSTERCVKRKKTMRLVMVLWTTAAILGIAVYVLLYVVVT